MRVNHVSTYSSRGGAAVAARRMHLALRQENVDSRMFTRFDRDPQNQIFSEEPSMKYLERGVRVLKRMLHHYRQKKVRFKYAPVQDFILPNTLISGDSIKPTREIYACDVLHIHHTVGFYDIAQLVEEAPSNIRIVISLHDLLSITGICTHPLACERYIDSCGKCPVICSDKDRDLSAKALLRKGKAYIGRSKDSLMFLAHSNWSRASAEKSSITEGYLVDCIPLMVDTDMFRPVKNSGTRQAMGIASDAIVLVIGAADLSNPVKGFDMFQEAINNLPNELRSRLLVLTFGNTTKSLSVSCEVKNLGPVGSEEILNLILSCGDCFVIPSRAETFCQVALEAMSAGLPIVGNPVGALPELIQNGRNGFISSEVSCTALASSLASFLALSKCERSTMGLASRATVVRENSVSVNARRLNKLYAGLWDSTTDP